MTDTVYDMVILGAGSGGYAAALRGAQLGLKVALVEADGKNPEEAMGIFAQAATGLQDTDGVSNAQVAQVSEDGTAAQVHLLVGRRGLGGRADPGNGAGLGDNCGVVKRAALADRTEF